MTTTETDLQHLEEYLDGELDDSAIAGLRAKLQSDPALGKMLNEIQSQRTMRQAVWKSIESDDGSSERLTWRIRGAMLDQQRNPVREPKTFWSQWRTAGVGSAVAACLLVGFTAGRLVHQGGNVIPAVAPANDPNATSVAMNHGNPTGTFTANGSVPRIAVPVTNEYGQVVAWQTFDNAEQAKNFTEDLHQTHTGAPSAAGQTKLATDEQVQPQQEPF